MVFLWVIEGHNDHFCLQVQDMGALKELGGVQELAGFLKTDVHLGLDPGIPSGLASVAKHKEYFGTNTFKEVPPKSFLSLVMENIKDPIIILLIAAATVSLENN